jgi:hypothetical protein
LIVHSRGKSAPHTDLIKNDISYPGTNFEIAEMWPKYTSGCPDGVPSNVEKFYVQGLENMAAARWDAAGAMFRKSLDVATKLIAPEKRSKTLYARINELVAEGRLTDAMGEWSHEIRLDGNDAVHDEEPETEQDANITQGFTEAFLTYTFTLPAMVEANRAKRNSPEVNPAPS